MRTSQAPDTLGGTDPFRLLGVSRECSPEALHRAYRELARRTHPDRNEDPRANAQMRLINTAYLAAQQELRLRARRPVRPAMRSGVGSAAPSAASSATPSAASASASPASSAPAADMGRTEREPVEPEPAEREPAEREPAERESAAATSHAEPAQPPPAEARSVPTASVPTPADETTSPRGAEPPPGGTRPPGATDPVPAVTALVVQERPRVSAQPTAGAWTAAWVPPPPRTITIPVPTPKRAGPAGAWADLSLGRRLVLGALSVLLVVVVAGVGWLLTQPDSVASPHNRAHASQAVEGHTLWTLPVGSHPTESLQWSPDHQYVAITSTLGSTSQVSVLRLPDAQSVLAQSVATFSGGSDPRWSPVSDQLAFVNQTATPGSPKLRVVTFAASGTPPEQDASGSSPAWSPDGTRLALSANGQREIDLLQSGDTTLVSWYKAPRGERVTPLLWVDAQTLLCLRMDATSTQVIVTRQGANPQPVVGLAPGRILGAWLLGANNGSILIASHAPTQESINLGILNAQTGIVRPLGLLPGMKYIAGIDGSGQWLVAASAHDSRYHSRLCFVPTAILEHLADLVFNKTCLVVDGSILELGWVPGLTGVSYLADMGKGTPIKLETVAIPAKSR